VKVLWHKNAQTNKTKKKRKEKEHVWAVWLPENKKGTHRNDWGLVGHTHTHAHSQWEIDLIIIK